MMVTITSSLLEKKEMMAMVRPFSLEEKEENVMIMTIPNPLPGKKKLEAMVIPFPLKQMRRM